MLRLYCACRGLDIIIVSTVAIRPRRSVCSYDVHTCLGQKVRTRVLAIVLIKRDKSCGSSPTVNR